MNEKLILTDNELVWLMKHKDSVSIYVSDGCDYQSECILSREDKLKIIKFLLDTI